MRPDVFSHIWINLKICKTMVVLREGMCPGLDEDLLRDLRAADIKTG